MKIIEIIDQIQNFCREIEELKEIKNLIKKESSYSDSLLKEVDKQIENINIQKENLLNLQIEPKQSDMSVLKLQTPIKKEKEKDKNRYESKEKIIYRY